MNPHQRCEQLAQCIDAAEASLWVLSDDKAHFVVVSAASLQGPPTHAPGAALPVATIPVDHPGAPAASCTAFDRLLRFQEPFSCHELKDTVPLASLSSSPPASSTGDVPRSRRRWYRRTPDDGAGSNNGGGGCRFLLIPLWRNRKVQGAVCVAWRRGITDATPRTASEACQKAASAKGGQKAKHRKLGPRFDMGVRGKLLQGPEGATSRGGLGADATVSGARELLTEGARSPQLEAAAASPPAVPLGLFIKEAQVQMVRQACSLAASLGHCLTVGDILYVVSRNSESLLTDSLRLPHRPAPGLLYCAAAVIPWASYGPYTDADADVNESVQEIFFSATMGPAASPRRTMAASAGVLSPDDHVAELSPFAGHSLRGTADLDVSHAGVPSGGAPTAGSRAGGGRPTRAAASTAGGCPAIQALGLDLTIVGRDVLEAAKADGDGDGNGLGASGLGATLKPSCTTHMRCWPVATRGPTAAAALPQQPAILLVPNAQAAVRDGGCHALDVLLAQEVAARQFHSVAVVWATAPEAAVAGSGPAVGPSNVHQGDTSTYTTSTGRGSGESEHPMAGSWGSGMAPQTAADGAVAKAQADGVQTRLVLLLCCSDQLPVDVLSSLAEDAARVIQLCDAPVRQALTAGPAAASWAQLLRERRERGGQAPEQQVLQLYRKPLAPAQPPVEVLPRHWIDGIDGSGMLVMYDTMAPCGKAPRDGSREWNTSPSVVPPAVTPVPSADALRSYNSSPLQMAMRSVTNRILHTLMSDQLNGTGKGQRCDDVSALRLLEPIGQGGQGTVYRGQLHHLEVAVKVCKVRGAPDAGSSRNGDDDGDALVRPAVRQQQATPCGGQAASCDVAPSAPAAADPPGYCQLEAMCSATDLAVARSLPGHPNVVALYTYFTNVELVEPPGVPAGSTEPPPPAPPPPVLLRGGSQPPERSSQHKQLAPPQQPQPRQRQRHLAMVMEYCDARDLRVAAEAGQLLKGWTRDCCRRELNLQAIYTTLLEVALALRHLHRHGLVHCDVKPGNILLRGSARDPRGWTAKLSDFGCVRLLGETDKATGRPSFRLSVFLGSYTHMAPEMFTKGKQLDATVDVYALGIIMWELAMLAPLYSGLAPAAVVAAIRSGMRPRFTNAIPPDYVALARWCWSQDPAARPSASAVVNTLQHLLATVTQVSRGPSLQVASSLAGKSPSRGPHPLAAEEHQRRRHMQQPQLPPLLHLPQHCRQHQHQQQPLKLRTAADPRASSPVRPPDADGLVAPSGCVDGGVSVGRRAVAATVPPALGPSCSAAPMAPSPGPWSTRGHRPDADTCSSSHAGTGSGASALLGLLMQCETMFVQRRTDNSGVSTQQCHQDGVDSMYGIAPGEATLADAEPPAAAAAVAPAPAPASAPLECMPLASAPLKHMPLARQPPARQFPAGGTENVTGSAGCGRRAIAAATAAAQPLTAALRPQPPATAQTQAAGYLAEAAPAPAVAEQQQQHRPSYGMATSHGPFAVISEVMPVLDDSDVENPADIGVRVWQPAGVRSA